MARSALNAPAVLRAITAAAVITMLTANPASARPDPAAEHRRVGSGGMPGR